MLQRFKRYGEEFKTFAMRGNVIDMAVGIIIGAAFGKVVDSLVKDVIMPPLGWLLGRVDFSNLYLVLPNYDGKFISYPSLESAQAAGAVTINYGLFINTLISFTIVSFAVFILIKGINKLRATKTEECEKSEVDTTKECPYCFTKIDVRATKCPNCTAALDS
ncbi:MAG: large-conductance mechanosensitive channel protein MscL [Muribaculaceae bacterium]|nr:large-conductance mechanosensitive channel protein MscL [Muribaculaceae bacterium]